MTQRVYSEHRGEGMVAELKEGYRFRVESSSRPGMSHLVDLSAPYCSCEHHAHTEAFCRHLVLAEAVAGARSLRFGSFAAEEAVTGLCKRIFDRESTTPRETYALFLETSGCRFATKAMVRAAGRRHKRTLARAGKRAA